MSALARVEPVLAGLDGTVSVWWGLPGRAPAYARLAGATHYPASTMKVGVMAAAYRQADAGRLNLDTAVPVHKTFTSAIGGEFDMNADYDGDRTVWERLGEEASLRWLIRRMIVRSSNLATNLVLERIGYAAAQEVWRVAGADDSRTRRGIEDSGAAEAGVDNEITAADLASLLAAIKLEQIASPAACAEMLEVLSAQEIHVDFARGLPDGTPIALKNGWVDGVRHSAAIISPGDAPDYILVACASTAAANGRDEGRDAVCEAYTELSRLAWEHRRTLTD